MSRRRKCKLKVTEGRIKKFYILSIIFIILSSVFNFTVISYDDLPDLKVDFIAPNTAVEGDNITFNVTVENIGDGDVPEATAIEVGLFIDNEYNPISTNVTYGLSSGTFKYVNLYWIAEVGEHFLRVIVDYNNQIIESNELNNEKLKYIEVSEGPPLIVITRFYTPENIKVGELVEIDVSVKNVGSNTSETISAELDIVKDEFTEIKKKTGGLSRGETHNFSFEWSTKNFGNHTLLLIVKHGSDVHDQDEKTRDVYPYKSEWWNENWHYRKLIGLYGNGTFSEEFNFTKLLKSLNISLGTFENDTIRIIEYATNGGIRNDTINYNFTESSGFDKKGNATGVLTWKVTEPLEQSVIKYYYIYFDVEENNQGIRNPINETENMTASNFTIIYDSPVEGWWGEIKQPINDSYSIVGQPFNITAKTKAKADSVIAFLWKKNASNNYTKTLTHDGSYLNWSDIIQFEKNDIGNWTIRVLCEDSAGYENETAETNFYVGKPDLAVDRIIYTPSKIYKNDIVAISAYVRSYNITMEDVIVSLNITDSEDNVVYNKIIPNLTLIKDQAKIVNFSWTAEQIGDYTLEVEVYHSNITDEWNNSNNNKTRSISVVGLPDLGVVDIVVPSGVVREGDSVEIQAVLNNTGNAFAKNYKVRLYLSPKYLGMDWNDNQIKDTTNVSIDVNESKEVTLTWNPAQYGPPGNDGEWIVGVLIFWNNTYRDSFTRNNSQTARLRVVEGEKNAPVIKIKELTNIQEIGKSVSIVAEITDKSGIKKVNITVINPKNTTYIGNMKSQGNNNYIFEFNNTLIIGEYNFSITATDNSFYQMQSTVYGAFEIIGDATPPYIDYFGAYPTVQLKGGYVNISCISTDFMGVKSVRVMIKYPDSRSATKSMTNSTSTGKYVYSQTYGVLGKYVFNISSEDTSGNIRYTENKEFWITTDIDDVDGDGMPDWWEERYGFDPYDPTDAEQDEDGDGYTNIEEYNNGNNPLKRLSSLQEIVYKLRENWSYLIISVILFILIIALSIYGLKRKKT